jgi:hypothetical protein
MFVLPQMRRTELQHTNEEDRMRAILFAGMLLLPSNNAYSQQITTGNTVNVPANGRLGGLNASVWKAECDKGMVMTGIEIVVGGTCHSQCSNDGRPLATFGIHCSPLQAGESTR